MTDTHRPTANGPRLPALGILVAAALSALAAPAARAQGVVVNSTTTERYRQQAVQGHRQHDYSPTTPPRGGRFIYGHWTPYTPPDPASLPADAKKHVIARGDTLWDIAGKYYKDNYLWPYVWEANAWVQYPHWIYPGDTLLIPPLMVLPPGDLTAEDTVQLPSILADYFPAGGEDAVYCGHFIKDPNEKPFGRIVGTEVDPSPILSGRNDLVYVNVGSKDGALPGDEFAILYPREHLAANPTELKWQRNDILKHPVTGEPLGVVMKMSGRLKIVLLGEEVSTAVITHSCDAIETGWDIEPFTEVPIPLVHRRERLGLVLDVPKRGRGHIVWMEDMTNQGARGTKVSIDLGSKEGVMPGDVFLVWRDRPSDPLTLDVEHLGRGWDMRDAVQRRKLRRDPTVKSVFGKQDPVYQMPPRLIGELVVLYTEDHTATARVLQGRREVYVGDRIVYEPGDAGLSQVAVVNAPLDPSRPLSQQQQAIPRQR